MGSGAGSQQGEHCRALHPAALRLCQPSLHLLYWAEGPPPPESPSQESLAQSTGKAPWQGEELQHGVPEKDAKEAQQGTAPTTGLWEA